jgi:outer membrane murein-binding lipoprotein Lpp
MTRLIGILLFAISFFMLSGCTDSEKVAEIQELTAKKDSLERNIGILRIKADSLARENEALHKQLSDLDMD